MKNIFKKEFNSKGIVKINNIINSRILEKLNKKINLIFNNIMIEKKIITNPINIFQYPNILRKFKNNFPDLFLNIKHKAIQKLPEVYEIGNSKKIKKYLKSLGLKSPVYSTDPLIMMHHNSTNISAKGDYAPLHQDWRSIQGSLNCIVIWIPIAELNDKMGNIEYYPSSHLQGLLPTLKHSWYRKVDFSLSKKIKIKKDRIKKGDAFFFSSFLIHKSAINKDNKIRVSLQFRYNDIEDKDYIRRGYPCNYIHSVPKKKLLKKDIPELEKIKRLYK